ncbi:Uncharacterized protein TCM_021985 [Theobroma cacao]|uniref:Uncharacterized protein n=1 Tax=Theobroma cacao TaxID=3641 RepID=A0A061ESF2_THECC|nr:Uncharacterized protein TCM_021985 [Theobroma cacao]
MSQRPNRHQRKPSQSVFVSFEDLSAPLSDNATDNKLPAPPTNQAPPSLPVRARALPPPPPTAAPAPAETKENVAKDDNEPKNATS